MNKTWGSKADTREIQSERDIQYIILGWIWVEIPDSDYKVKFISNWRRAYFGKLHCLRTMGY